MHKLTFLGMGQMGRRMARQLAAAGYDVTAWSRSRWRPTQSEYEHDSALGKLHIDDDLGRAVSGADIVLAMVRDDDASKELWFGEHDNATKHMPSDAIAIDCSTLSSHGADALSHQFTLLNRRFIHAPVAGSLPQAEASKLIFLAGGPTQLISELNTLWETMGQSVKTFASPALAAKTKLAINTVLGVQAALFAELLPFLSSDIHTQSLMLDAITQTPVCSPAAALLARAMLAENYAPAFPIALVAKDFGLVQSSSQNDLRHMPITQKTLDLFRHADSAGLGADNITGIAQLYS